MAETNTTLSSDYTMINIKKQTKSQNKQRKKGHSGHSAEDGGKRPCSAGGGNGWEDLAPVLLEYHEVQPGAGQ